jgi:hypothetical protein
MEKEATNDTNKKSSKYRNFTFLESHAMTDAKTAENCDPLCSSGP